MPENFRRAGALRERLHFQRRGDSDDGFGNPVPGGGDFETQFTRSAGMRPRTGGEEVTAARLGGRQPYIVTVRNDAQTRSITVAWQIEDARVPGRVLAVVSPPSDPDGRNQWLEFLAVEGQAS